MYYYFTLIFENFPNFFFYYSAIFLSNLYFKVAHLIFMLICKYKVNLSSINVNKLKLGNKRYFFKSGIFFTSWRVMCKFFVIMGWNFWWRGHHEGPKPDRGYPAADIRRISESFFGFEIVTGIFWFYCFATEKKQPLNAGYPVGVSGPIVVECSWRQTLKIILAAFMFVC